MDTRRIQHFHTKMIAHRGLSGLECENTCAAFVAAGNRDYYGIETDVHKTADGRFVVIHDDDTARVASEKLSVEGSDFETLRSLRLYDIDGTSRADLKIPTLKEYLGICRKYEKTAVLELKNDFAKAEVEQIIEIVKDNYSIDHMVFISFSYQNLCYIRELLPQAAIQFLCSCEVDERLVEQLKAHAFDLDIDYGYLTEDHIRLLHDNGIRVNCWTVDDAEYAEKLIAWGVDFITTNILQ